MPNALIFFYSRKTTEIEDRDRVMLSSQNQANNVPDCEYVSSDCIHLPSTLLLDFLRIRQQQKNSNKTKASLSSSAREQTFCRDQRGRRWHRFSLVATYPPAGGIMRGVPLLICRERHLTLRPHGDPGAAGAATPPPKLITTCADLPDLTAHNCIQQSHHYRADNGVRASKEKGEISGAGKRERGTGHKTTRSDGEQRPW